MQNFEFLNSNDNKPAEYKLLIGIASFYYLFGKPTAAINVLHLAYKRFPEEQASLEMLALLYCETMHFTLADAVLKKLEPVSGELRPNLLALKLRCEMSLQNR